MENLKVKDLKALAKERGIKGYYRMRKAELIQALTPVGDPSQLQNIMDQPIPEIDILILTTEESCLKGCKAGEERDKQVCRLDNI